MVPFGSIDVDANRSASSNSSPDMDTASVTPVAVIGMACRLPGGIETPAQLWDALLRGDHLIAEIPSDRWEADEYFDPEPGVPGRSVSKWGAFLDDISGFDADFFGISESEAVALDPQHRLLLENSWEAMEHAGLQPERLRNSRTGVFVGLTHSDYQLIAADSPVLEGPYGVTGTAFSMASGRIAHTLGLQGPALTVDTAGSSGLLAVHMACRSLHDGESDLAFAGGAFVMLEPRKFLAGTAMGDLSPTGRCRAFDIAADGCVYGEGSAVVLLKRLPDALRDGDRVLAVVRGTAANHDGSTPDMSTPSQDAQTAVYRAALDNAGVDAESIGLVEAHGIGTRTGDSIEYASLTEVYGVETSCLLGSMKTNFGHTQSASGTLGLLKAVLALQHGVIPPNLDFTRLPDKVARTDTRLSVPQEITPWPTNGRHPRRAAVSSFGLSGTNVHAIVEQAPQISPADDRYDREAGGESTALLFTLSSTSAEELRRTAGMLADWLQAHDEVALPDLAYTLARRRAHRPLRAGVIATGRTDLGEALRKVAVGEEAYRPAVGQDERGPVLVFSGHAPQWTTAGAELLGTEPAFAATVARIEPLIARECGFSVTGALNAPHTITGVERSHPTLFTMQVALAAALDAHGVRPGAVIGHSLGEAAAAVVAGALSLDDGLHLVCSRSRLMARIGGGGGIASVQLPAKQVLSELTLRREKDVAVAIVAGPQTTVISGALEKVRELLAAWEQRDVTVTEFVTDVAVHSPQVDPILKELAEDLSALNPRAPKIPFYSATQFDPREEPWCDSRYWVDNLRRTARFAAAVRAALEDGYQVFAELTQHPLLADALQQTAENLDLPLASLAGPLNEQHLLDFVADLHTAGAAIDFSVLYPNGRLTDVPLPTWTHRRLWLSQEGREAPTLGGDTVSVHPLLGQHVRLPEEPERHVWQADVGTACQPWLSDHQIRNVPVLPAAAYCEMALAAARTALGEAEVRDIRFERTLSLGDQVIVSTTASVLSRDLAEFTVGTDDAGKPVRIASASLHGAVTEQPPARDISALLTAHPTSEDGAGTRKRLERAGIQRGAAFAGLSAVRTGDGTTVLAEVAYTRELRSQQDAYQIHPALLDACFTSVAAHPSVQAVGTGVQAMGLPLGVRRLRIYGDLRGAHYCYARVTTADSAAVEADIDVLDETGTVLLAVECLRLGSGATEEGHRERIMGERLLTVEWVELQLPELPQSNAGHWLLISTEATDVIATGLADALKNRGAQCITMSWPQHADATNSAAELGDHLRLGSMNGVVLLTDPRTGDADDQSAVRARDCAQHLALIVRELSEIPVGAPAFYVVTHNAQTVLPDDVANLELAGLRGLIRAIGADHPHLHAVHVDIDEATDVERLAQQVLDGSEEDETAWRNDQLYTARLSVSPLRPDERRTTVADLQRDRVRLQIRTPGDVESLELVACPRVPPGPGEVEVAVVASAINGKDVLLATDPSTGLEGHQSHLGTDFSGVVSAVGPGVVDHQVGDRVGGVADGCWSTFITCDANVAVALPAGLSDSQAAAVTTTYATAWYSLHDLARVATGDKVLIHSATGEVGQAAIAIARAAGAEVFATAVNTQCQTLRDMGIEHVYDSGDISFADAIRRDTHGYGVDIVLNSVTGAARRAGIHLLVSGGRFVEIGGTDMYPYTPVGVDPLPRNLAFFGLDLAVMSQTHPRRIQELLRTVYRLAADGEIPVPECTHYPLADATSAIRAMTGAGRVVLDIAHVGQSTVSVPPEHVPVFRDDGAYLLSGGPGQLRSFLAERMAAAGCGRIVLSSPTHPTPEEMQSIESVRAMGAEVEVTYGEIAEAATARRLVAAATATGLPVRGALLLTETADQATSSGMLEEFDEKDWASKVYGAWNMHAATIDQPLDWFCTFSSVAELVGSPGHNAAGAAADSWLNAFGLWRRAQGLPATAIAWGRWAGVEGPADAEGAVESDEGAYVLETLLRHDRGYTGYAPIHTMPWLTTLSQRSPFAAAFRVTGESTAGGRKLRAELVELPRDEWPTRLRRLMSDQVSLVLRRSIDPDRPLVEYGVDSLGALELLTRVEAESGIRLSAADLTTASIRDLAELLCGRLETVEAR